MALSLVWTKHLKDSEAKETFTKTVLASKTALNRLREILEEDLESLSKPSETDYASPSWAFLQAHRNGRIQQIKALLTLLEPIK